VSPVLRWARCPDDGRLHALAAVDVDRAGAQGYAETLCGHRLPADVAIEDDPAAPLCLPCVVGAVPDLRSPGQLGGEGEQRVESRRGQLVVRRAHVRA
jgi:hypothetical protein